MHNKDSMQIALDTIFNSGFILNNDSSVKKQVSKHILDCVRRYDSTIETLEHKQMHELEIFEELEMDLDRLRIYVHINDIIHPVFLEQAIDRAKLSTLDDLL